MESTSWQQLIYTYSAEGRVASCLGPNADLWLAEPDAVSAVTYLALMSVEEASWDDLPNLHRSL